LICFDLLFGIGAFQWVTRDSSLKNPPSLLPRWALQAFGPAHSHAAAAIQEDYHQFRFSATTFAKFVSSHDPGSGLLRKVKTEKGLD
jgi:hypothetical protein